MRKLSSYQKLKKENQRLKQELYTVICDPRSYEAQIIKMHWKIKKDISDIVWMGEYSTNEATK